MRFNPSPRLTASLSFLLFASPLSAQDFQDAGYQRSYTIHADAAWIAPGQQISPAYVTLTKGVITRVSQRAPEEKKGMFGMGGSTPRILKVSGTLAAGMVDLWSGLGKDLQGGDRHAVSSRRMKDNLLLGTADAQDQQLVSQILGVRDAGVALTYLSFSSGGMQRGLGVSASFNVQNLLHAEGAEVLELSLPGDAVSVHATAEGFREIFSDAQAWRDSWDEYDGKLEKYKEKLEKYEKELQEYLDKKDEEKKESAAGQESKDKKEEKLPTRPKPPKKPQNKSARDDVLAAMDGKSLVRLEAHSFLAIQEAIALKKEFGLSLFLVGGDDAHQLASELADAQIPVVLSLSTDESGGFPEQDMLSRWMTLEDHGVIVALSSGGLHKDLLFMAGQLIAQGADSEEVWSALTTIPAGILRLSEDFGRVRVGQSGSLLLFEGASPFDASAAVRAHKPR